MGYWIAAAVILFIAALLLTKIRLLFRFSDGKTVIAVKILFFRIDITEKAEERINKSKYKIKRFRRRRDKVLKKYRIKTQGKKAKSGPKEASEQPNDAPAEPAKKKKTSPKQIIHTITELFGEVIRVFPRYVHIEFKKLIIGVGGKDAADIAEKTGGVMQAVQYLITFFGAVTNVRKVKGGTVYVYPAFADGKWYACADVSAYVRVGNILRLGLIFVKNYIKRKLKKNK